LLDSLRIGPNTFWVEAVGSLLYAGNRDGVRVIDASDIHTMRVRDFAATPYSVKRLTYESPYIYAACWEAGICIFESTQVGIDHASPAPRRLRGCLHVAPNPATDRLVLTCGRYLDEKSAIVVRDVTGREVMRPDGAAFQSQSVRFSVAGLPGGVYFVEVTGAGRRESARFTKH
jgi:Secretion system C-terminal sorting domain